MLSRVNSKANFGEYQKTFMKLNPQVVEKKQLPEIFAKLDQVGLKPHITELDRQTREIKVKIEGDEAVSKLNGMKNAFKNAYGDLYISATKEQADTDISKAFSDNRRGFSKAKRK
jgi:hypothetical protein